MRTPLFKILSLMILLSTATTSSVHAQVTMKHLLLGINQFGKTYPEIGTGIIINRMDVDKGLVFNQHTMTVSTEVGVPKGRFALGPKFTYKFDIDPLTAGLGAIHYTTFGLGSGFFLRPEIGISIPFIEFSYGYNALVTGSIPDEFVNRHNLIIRMYVPYDIKL